MRGMQTIKKEVKLPLFTDSLRNVKKKKIALLELRSDLTRTLDTRSIYKNQLHFYIQAMDNLKFKYIAWLSDFSKFLVIVPSQKHQFE